MNIIATAVRRRSSTFAALATLLAVTLGPATLAQAHGTPTTPQITLSVSPQDSAEWIVTGTGFAPSTKDVTVLIGNMDSNTVTETQTKIATSSPGLCTPICFQGGSFTARSTEFPFWFYGEYLGLVAAYPLQCNTHYMAAAMQPEAGSVFSNTVTTPPCLVQNF